MKNFRITLIFLLPVFLSACGGHAPFECFESKGPDKAEEVGLPEFRKIVVYDNIDLYLLNGTGQKVVVHAGQNLLSKIEMNVSEGVLTIHNKNSCGWSRSPGNPGIYIYSDALKRIEIYGYSNIYTPDTLNIRSLYLYTYGTGDFDMTVQGDSLFVESEFIANYYINGDVNYLSVYFTNDSQFHGRDLVAQDVFVDHRGSNSIEVFPVNLLKGTLISTGNLYYYHNPDELVIKLQSSGKAVAKY